MASAFITILDHLGGPKLTEEDVDWVCELPSGKTLLDFLASQIQGADVASSLRDIALEKEEGKLWHQALRMNLVTPEPPSLTPTQSSELPLTPLEYVVPSLLRNELNSIEEEQGLLDRQLSLLDARMRKTRNIAKVEKQADKATSTARNHIAKTISGLEGELSDLSQRADSTVLSAVQSASQCLNELAIKPDQGGHHAYQHTQELADLIDEFSAISLDISRFSSAWMQRLPNDPLASKDVEPLQAEMHRLARAIRELEDKHIATTLEEEFKQLEGPETLERWLSTTAESDSNQVNEDRWVEIAVSQAWNREHAADLRRKTEGFEQIANLLRDEVLPPLALIYASLGLSHQSVEEAHVVLQALVDELDDMEADLSPADGFLKPLSWPLDSTHVLEGRARDLLKRLRGSRPADISSLVLTDRADVVSELSDVRARYDRVNAEIATLPMAISSDLLALKSSSQTYLSALTVHSPMMTTQPISMPFEVQQQALNAKAQIAEASQTLEKLSPELQKDGRVLKKLDIFIETHSR